MNVASRLRALALPAAMLLLSALAAAQKTAGQDPPGPLSRAHSASPGLVCQACHGPDQKVLPSNCLACHPEIARQNGAPKGYHRDKAEGCADCHAEHLGEGKSIVPLDVKDFDHSETGAERLGAHRRVVECARCHRPENSLPRTLTRSFILKDAGCRSCHRSPHSGRQDDCLSCHNQDSWTVDRGPGRA